jgi:hypothetical protein
VHPRRPAHARAPAHSSLQHATLDSSETMCPWCACVHACVWLSAKPMPTTKRCVRGVRACVHACVWLSANPMPTTNTNASIEFSFMRSLLPRQASTDCLLGSARTCCSTGTRMGGTTRTTSGERSIPRFPFTAPCPQVRAVDPVTIAWRRACSL